MSIVLDRDSKEVTLIIFLNIHMVAWLFVNNWEVTLIKGENLD